MINVRYLEKHYGSFCLDIEDLVIKDGEIFGLVGNNGAGKTTFLRSIMHLIQPENGEIFIDEINVLKKETLKKEGKLRAYLNEKFLIPYLTPREYIDITAELLQLSEGEVENIIEQYSDLLPDSFGEGSKLIRELSTGNKIRTGIVGALLSSPDYLLLDEPFANLDPTSRKILNQYLETLNQNNGTTIIVSSHDIANVADLCTRISILEEGEIVRDISASDKSYEELEEYFSVEEASEKQ